MIGAIRTGVLTLYRNQPGPLSTFQLGDALVFADAATVLLLDAQEDIKSQVQEELGERQREMFLREQLKTIQRELGEGDERDDLQDELRKQGMRNIYAYGYQLTTNGVDPIVTGLGLGLLTYAYPAARPSLTIESWSASGLTPTCV